MPGTILVAVVSYTAINTTDINTCFICCFLLVETWAVGRTHGTEQGIVDAAAKSN